MLARSPAAWPSWAFSNHDVARVVSRWGGADEADPAFARLLIALLCSLRGTIFLYQGEELGLPQADVPYDRLRDPEGIAFWPRHRGRDGARTPMPWRADAPNAGFSAVEPWLPVDPRHPPLAVDRQRADPSSVLAFTRSFLEWRKRQPALVGGTLRFVDAPEPLLAFERQAGTQRLLCVFNLAGAPQRWAEAVPGAWRPLAVPGAHGTLGEEGASLPPFGMLYAGAGD
jgi:alpha-glucosidase